MRKSQVIWVLCVLLLLAGCRPKGILTSRQMRNVLYDLHRADAILQVAGMNYGHDEELAKYYQVVLDKNHITKAEFDSSLVWYTDHPQIFNKIYPKVVKRCEQEQKDLEAELLLLAKTPTSSAPKVPVRDLLPIDSVKHTMQYGYSKELLIRLGNSSDDDL